MLPALSIMESERYVWVESTVSRWMLWTDPIFIDTSGCIDLIAATLSSCATCSDMSLKKLYTKFALVDEWKKPKMSTDFHTISVFLHVNKEIHGQSCPACRLALWAIQARPLSCSTPWEVVYRDFRHDPHDGIVRYIVLLFRNQSRRSISYDPRQYFQSGGESKNALFLSWTSLSWTWCPSLCNCFLVSVDNSTE